MSQKWTADRAKRESEDVILRVLAFKSPQRWGDLLDQTKLSSRTLKNALDRLEKKGQVYRQVKQGKEYPPPVLYGLLSESSKSITPIIFAANAKNYALGLELSQEQVGEAKKATRFFLKTEKEDLKERLALLVQRIGVLQLFVLLKALEERNFEWTDEMANLLKYNEHIGIALDLLSGTGFVLVTSPLEEWEEANIKNELKKSDVSFLESAKIHKDVLFLVPPSKKIEMPERHEVRKLQSLLKQLYPEDVKKFEEFVEQASRFDEIPAGESSSKGAQ